MMSLHHGQWVRSSSPGASEPVHALGPLLKPISRGHERTLLPNPKDVLAAGFLVRTLVPFRDTTDRIALPLIAPAGLPRHHFPITRSVTSTKR